MRQITKTLAVLCMAIFVQPVSASIVNTLQDWCFSVNGDLSSCNNSSSSNPAVNLSGFDTTIGLNNLGTATITLGGGANQYVSFYADYDINYSMYLSYNDNATTTNLLSAGQSYSIADPNNFVDSSPSGYYLFDLFANNLLDDANTAGTPNNQNNGSPQCCDIAFAMSFSNINVDPNGGSAVINFTVSSVAPESGFYITQASNDGTQPPLYLYGNVEITAGEADAPEVSTAILGAGGLGMAVFFARRKRMTFIRYKNIC